MLPIKNLKHKKIILLNFQKVFLNLYCYLNAVYKIPQPICYNSCTNNINEPFFMVRFFI